MHLVMTRSAGRFVLLYLLMSLLFAAATLGLCAAAHYGMGRLEAEAALAEQEQTPAPPACIVLDAGHGGEDGGAVGVDGLLEKQVNLRVALMLCDQLRLAGIPVVMTRTDDRMLYDPSADYRGHKKMLDLRTRLDIVQSTPGAVLVSIHQNAFPQAQYSGLQVYYSPNHADSARLAELVQATARQYLQPENTRKTKAADSGIYLLHRSTCPAILVECGFLSNPAECARLGDEAYIGSLSTLLLAAICEYFAAVPEGT